jgi:hypothetical protein
MGNVLNHCGRRATNRRRISFGFQYETNDEDATNITGPLVPLGHGTTEELALLEAPIQDKEISDHSTFQNRCIPGITGPVPQAFLGTSVVAQPAREAVIEATAPPAEWLVGPTVYINISRPPTVETASSPITTLSDIVELVDTGVNTDASYTKASGTSTDVTEWLSIGVNTNPISSEQVGVNTDSIGSEQIGTNTVVVNVASAGTNTELPEEILFLQPTPWELLYLRLVRLRFLRRLHAQLGYVLQDYSNIRPHFRAE